MTGCWLVKMNGVPVIEPSENNSHNPYVEGCEVLQLVWDTMMKCNHNDTIEIFCELPE